MPVIDAYYYSLDIRRLCLRRIASISPQINAELWIVGKGRKSKHGLNSHYDSLCLVGRMTNVVNHYDTNRYVIFSL